MVKIPVVSLKDILRFNEKVIHEYGNSILVADAHISDLYLTQLFPIRTCFYMFVLVESGEMKIELDTSVHFLEKCDFLLILPEHIYQSIEAREDTRYKLIFIEEEYFKMMNIDKNDIFKNHFLDLRINPIIKLSEKDFLTLSACYQRLKDRIILPHFLKNDIIKINLTEYIIEVENIILANNEQIEFKHTFSRKDKIYQDFLILVKQNAQVQHDVAFYAESLNITSQYLNSILKQISGKSTKDWILDVLLIKAKILLKHSNESVQQISNSLNFYDQSTFGKFFKSRTGHTPKKYQKFL